MVDNQLRSNIASTSTATPNGRLLVLTAALACDPSSSNTLFIRSDAPFITFGCSVKSSVELTMEEALILIEKRKEYDRNKKKKKSK